MQDYVIFLKKQKTRCEKMRASSIVLFPFEAKIRRKSEPKRFANDVLTVEEK